MSRARVARWTGGTAAALRRALQTPGFLRAPEPRLGAILGSASAGLPRTPAPGHLSPSAFQESSAPKAPVSPPPSPPPRCYWLPRGVPGAAGRGRGAGAGRAPGAAHGPQPAPPSFLGPWGSRGRFRRRPFPPAPRPALPACRAPARTCGAGRWPFGGARRRLGSPGGVGTARRALKEGRGRASVASLPWGLQGADQREGTLRGRPSVVPPLWDPRAPAESAQRPEANLPSSGGGPGGAQPGAPPRTRCPAAGNGCQRTGSLTAGGILKHLSEDPGDRRQVFRRSFCSSWPQSLLVQSQPQWAF